VGQYFIINYQGSVHHFRKDFSTDFDALIPFYPKFFYIYLSTYIFGVLPFFLVSNTQLFLWIMFGYIMITVIGSTVHIVYPSEVKRMENLDQNEFTGKVMCWFQQLCRPYDNFPSTHVAFSVLVCRTCFISNGPIIGWMCVVWAFLIAISTLVTKQHYLLDVVSGWLLGLVVVLMIYLII
jgi:membrane-associated phospholipid phosphatase